MLMVGLLLTAITGDMLFFLIFSLGVPAAVLVVSVWPRVKKLRAEWALGPRVVDTVERGDGRDYELRIASCRQKPNWNHLRTISFEDELYEVAKQEEGKPPRRFVYLLRKMPEGKVIHGLHHYRRDEVLDRE